MFFTSVEDAAQFCDIHSNLKMNTCKACVVV
jgi:hypothetical protein